MDRPPVQRFQSCPAPKLVPGCLLYLRCHFAMIVTCRSRALSPRLPLLPGSRQDVIFIAIIMFSMSSVKPPSSQYANHPADPTSSVSLLRPRNNHRHADHSNPSKSPTPPIWPRHRPARIQTYPLFRHLPLAQVIECHQDQRNTQYINPWQSDLGSIAVSPRYVPGVLQRSSRHTFNITGTPQRLHTGPTTTAHAV